MAARKLGGRPALIVDDEPEYLGWVADFFRSIGIRAEFALTISDAVDCMSRQKYELLLIDMNIPAGAASVDEISKNRSDLVGRYPGIALAFYARNNGYREFQVIAYTVHDDDTADAELQRLNCRYVLKGRPDVLKIVVKRSLERLKRSRGGFRSRGKPKNAKRSG